MERYNVEETTSHITGVTYRKQLYCHVLPTGIQPGIFSFYKTFGPTIPPFNFLSSGTP